MHDFIQSLKHDSRWKPLRKWTPWLIGGVALYYLNILLLGIVFILMGVTF